MVEDCVYREKALVVSKIVLIFNMGKSDFHEKSDFQKLIHEKISSGNFIAEDV